MATAHQQLVTEARADAAFEEAEAKNEAYQRITRAHVEKFAKAMAADMKALGLGYYPRHIETATRFNTTPYEFFIDCVLESATECFEAPTSTDDAVSNAYAQAAE